MVLRRNRIESEVCVCTGISDADGPWEGVCMYFIIYLPLDTNNVSGNRNDKRAGVQAKPGSVTAPNWGIIQLNHLKAQLNPAGL